MSGVYYDVSIAAIDALVDYPSDVDGDDDQGGTLSEQQRRRLVRRILWRAIQARHAAAVSPRVNVDKTRIIFETDNPPPPAIVVQGPMTAAQCRVWINNAPAWANG